MPYVPLKRHFFVENINLYDPENYEYLEKRLVSSSRYSVLFTRVKSKPVQKQKGICFICKNYLLNGKNLDVRSIQSSKDCRSGYIRNGIVIT